MTNITRSIRRFFSEIRYRSDITDVLSACSNEKASRRSERSESEERHWNITRDLENYATRYTRRPTHKRLDCSDHHPSLRNVNVTIDSSSAEHQHWWRWNVKYFERIEIASYTWRSSTHQHNFFKIYDKVGSRVKHEENPEQLHARRKSKRALVEYSWRRSHQRNDAVEIARNFLAESLYMRFRLTEKKRRMTWTRCSCDLAWSWTRYTVETDDQSACKRQRDRTCIVGTSYFDENLLSDITWHSKNDGVPIWSRLDLVLFFLESIIFPQRSRMRRLSSRSRDRSNGRQQNVEIVLRISVCLSKRRVIHVHSLSIFFTLFESDISRRLWCNSAKHRRIVTIFVNTRKSAWRAA